MPTMAEQIQDSERRIKELEFELAVERKVVARLRAIEQSASAGNDDGGERFVRGSLTSEVNEVFVRLNRPVSNDELLRELEAKGITTTAKAGLKGMVASVLSKRDDLFVRIDRGVYDLKARHVQSERKDDT